MWLIKIVLFISLTTVTTLFALANKQVVSVNLAFVDMELNAPLFVIILVSFTFGVIVYGVAASLNKISHMRTKYIQEQKIQALESEVAALRAEQKIKESV
jgi:uncharacterized integral membrane protein